jgi:hypothetical protein
MSCWSLATCSGMSRASQEASTMRIAAVARSAPSRTACTASIILCREKS